jgi:hypothetical protein
LCVPPPRPSPDKPKPPAPKPVSPAIRLLVPRQAPGVISPPFSCCSCPYSYLVPRFLCRIVLCRSCASFFRFRTQFLPDHPDFQQNSLRGDALLNGFELGGSNFRRRVAG